MHSADCAVVKCPSVRPSVRPSVTRRYCVETAKHVMKFFFTGAYSRTILVVHSKRYGNIAMATSQRGRRMQDV